MAVVGTRYQSGFGNVQTLGTAIHAALLLQGWTIEYANADAIGTGSAASPAWTKAFVASTSAGIVVYRMPANGTLNRWYLQIELRWGTAVTRVAIRLATAQGVNTTTGVLTATGTTYGSPDNADSVAGDSWLGTSENGILVLLNGSSATSVGFERRRDFAGNVQDDCVSYILISSSAPIGFGTASGCDNLVRSWTAGERTPQPLGIMIGQGNNTISSARAVTTYNQPAGNVGFPIGFYTTSGGLGGMLRLAQLWLATDSNNLATQDVFVDGSVRQYFGFNTSSLTPNAQRILLAQS